MVAVDDIRMQFRVRVCVQASDAKIQSEAGGSADRIERSVAFLKM